MKKTMGLFLTMALTVAFVSGCLTSAGAHTKKTISKDGTVTIESDVNVIGTGDKVSSIAADGMFADGTDDALGAGVKKASASQQSTGIGETLTGLGALLKGLAALEEAKATHGVVSSPVSEPEAVVESAPISKKAAPPLVVKSDAPASASVSEAPPAATIEPPRTITGGGTSPKLVILGDRPNCVYCRGLWAGIDAAKLSSDLCGAAVIDADKTSNPSVYNELRPREAFSYPYVLVYNEMGAFAGQFVARGMTQATLEAKVRELVPGCAAAPK